MNQLTEACGDLLEQLDSAIGSIADVAFSSPCPALGGATVGQHVRHTLEFFLCLEEGRVLGVVNYDRRARSLALETDRFAALNTLRSIRKYAMSTSDDVPLLLEACYRHDSEVPVRIPTSYYRELAYNLEHAVHHMAIIRIGLRDVASGLTLPADFGVAASTARFRAVLSDLEG